MLLVPNRQLSHKVAKRYYDIVWIEVESYHTYEFNYTTLNGHIRDIEFWAEN